MISPFLGHKVRGVDFHYSNHEIDELGEKFKSALPFLLPQTVSKVKAENQKLIEQQQQKIDELKDKFAEKLAEKQRETVQAIVKMLNQKGIDAKYEYEGEEP